MTYKIFFNPDCAMYGVQALKSGVSYMNEPAKWVQVLPPRKTYGARNGQSAYTHYKGVAKRWIKELEKRGKS